MWSKRKLHLAPVKPEMTMGETWDVKSLRFVVLYERGGLGLYWSGWEIVSEHSLCITSKTVTVTDRQQQIISLSDFIIFRSERAEKICCWRGSCCNVVMEDDSRRSGDWCSDKILLCHYLHNVNIDQPSLTSTFYTVLQAWMALSNSHIIRYYCVITCITSI